MGFQAFNRVVNSCFENELKDDFGEAIKEFSFAYRNLENTKVRPVSITPKVLHECHYISFSKFKFILFGFTLWWIIQLTFWMSKTSKGLRKVTLIINILVNLYNRHHKIYLPSIETVYSDIWVKICFIHFKSTWICIMKHKDLISRHGFLEWAGHGSSSCGL